MFWLLTQIWVWVLVALLLGVAAGWALWARPIGRAADRRAADLAPDPGRHPGTPA